MDKHLIPIPAPNKGWLKKNGLAWFMEYENEDYLAPALVRVGSQELEAFRQATENLYKMMVEACNYVAKNNRWADLGLPDEAIPLMRHSLMNERHLHIIGRYDFSGGFDDIPLKLLEFNADTFSLLAETVHIQPHLSNVLQSKPYPFSYRTFDMLVHQFRAVLKRHPEREPDLLISDLGNEEDTLNLEVIKTAAAAAGFKNVHYMALERVVFSEEEGIFLELGPDSFRKYDFWYKMIPWDFIVFEEPDLLDTVSQIILNDECIVMNPAFTMMMQSKGLLPILSELFPESPYILKASLDKRDLAGKSHVAKPLYGRMGDNVQIYAQDHPTPVYENEGDYGHFPMVYQALAHFNEDSEEYRYQASLYWVGQPSGLCFRRQDDPVIDDDAEFVGHVVVG